MALRDRVQVKTTDATLTPQDVMNAPLYTQREFRDKVWNLVDQREDFGVTFEHGGTDLSPLQVKRAIIEAARDEGNLGEVAGRLDILRQDPALTEDEKHDATFDLAATIHTMGRQLHCRSSGEEREQAGKTLVSAAEMFGHSAAVAHGLPPEYANRGNIMARSYTEQGVMQTMLGATVDARESFTRATGADEALPGPKNNMGCVMYQRGDLDSALIELDEELTGRTHIGAFSLSEGSNEPLQGLAIQLRQMGGVYEGLADDIGNDTVLERQGDGWVISRGSGAGREEVANVAYLEESNTVEISFPPDEGGGAPLTHQFHARRLGENIHLFAGAEDETRDNPLARNNRGVIHSRRIDRAVRNGASEAQLNAILAEARADFDRADEMIAGGALTEGGNALTQIVARNRLIVGAKVSDEEVEIPDPVGADLFENNGIHVFSLQEGVGDRVYAQDEAIRAMIPQVKGEELFSLSLEAGAETLSGQLSASLRGMNQAFQKIAGKVGSNCTITTGGDGNFVINRGEKQVGTITHNSEEQALKIKVGLKRERLEVVEDAEAGVVRVFSGNPKHCSGLESLLGCEGGSSRLAELIQTANNAMGGNPLHPHAGGYLLGQEIYQHLSVPEKMALESAGLMEKPTTHKLLARFMGPETKKPDFQEIGLMFQRAAVLAFTRPEDRAELEAARSRSMLLQDVVGQTRNSSPFCRATNVQGAQVMGNLFLATNVLDDDELVAHAAASNTGTPEEREGGFRRFIARFQERLGERGLSVDAMNAHTQGVRSDVFWRNVLADYSNVRDHPRFVEADRQQATLGLPFSDLEDGDFIDFTSEGRRQRLEIASRTGVGEAGADAPALDDADRWLIRFTNGTAWNVGRDQRLGDHQNYVRESDSRFAIFNASNQREEAARREAETVNRVNTVMMACQEIMDEATAAGEEFDMDATENRVTFQVAGVGERDPIPCYITANPETNQWLIAPQGRSPTDEEEITVARPELNGVFGLTEQENEVRNRIRTLLDNGVELVLPSEAVAPDHPRPEETHALDPEVQAIVDPILAIGGFAGSLHFTDGEWDYLRESGFPPRTSTRTPRANLAFRGCEDVSMADMGAPAGMPNVFPEPTLVAFESRAGDVLENSESDENLCAIAYSQEVLTRARNSTSHTYYILLPETQARELHGQIQAGELSFTDVFDQALPERARQVFTEKRAEASERERHATPEILESRAASEQDELDSVTAPRPEGGGLFRSLRERIIGRRGGEPPPSETEAVDDCTEEATHDTGRFRFFWRRPREHAPVADAAPREVAENMPPLAEFGVRRPSDDTHYPGASNALSQVAGGEELTDERATAIHRWVDARWNEIAEPGRDPLDGVALTPELRDTVRDSVLWNAESAQTALAEAADNHSAQGYLLNDYRILTMLDPGNEQFWARRREATQAYGEGHGVTEADLQEDLDALQRNGRITADDLARILGGEES